MFDVVLFLMFHSTIRKMQMVCAVGSSTPLTRLKMWNMLSACQTSKTVRFINISHSYLDVDDDSFFSPVGGWAIPRKDLIKKSPIGKGEFGGEVGEGERDGGEGEGMEGERERERERERETVLVLLSSQRCG